MTRMTKTLLSAIAALVALLVVGLAVHVDGVTLSGVATLFSIGVFGMILDERLEFCDAVSVAAAAGTALVGDVIDLSVARNITSSNKPLYLVITVDTEIITGGSAGTIEFILASDAAAAIATDGTATEHFVSRKFVTDDANANDAILNAGGMPVCVPLPGEGAAYERYLGILVRTTTTTTTAGKINAFLTDTPKQWKAYADGIA
jgi:hypothetical protein